MVRVIDFKKGVGGISRGELIGKFSWEDCDCNSW
jgi:hypothetical protein